MPTVPNGSPFRAGHRIRLLPCSEDQSEGISAIMGFRRTAVGTSWRNAIRSGSPLLVPLGLSDVP